MMQRFSRREIRELLISWIALSVIFSIPRGANPLAFLLIAFTLGIAFIGHELSHKFVAQNFGFAAQYRMDASNLFFAFFLAVITSMTGFAIIFAAPGAVVIYPINRAGRPADRDQSGRISIAGITANLLFASLFAVVLLLASSPFLLILAQTGLWINAFLALFNLLPFGILDGKKVFAWSPKIWLAAVALALLALSLAY